MFCVSCFHLDGNQHTKTEAFFQKMDATTFRRLLEDGDRWINARACVVEQHFQLGETICSPVELVRRVQELGFYIRKLTETIEHAEQFPGCWTGQLGECVRTALAIFCIRANDSGFLAGKRVVAVGPHAALTLLRSFHTNLASTAPKDLPRFDANGMALFDYLTNTSGISAFYLIEAVFYGIVEPQASAGRRVAARPRHMLKVIDSVKALRSRFQTNGEVGKWPNWINEANVVSDEEGYLLAKFFRCLDSTSDTMRGVAYEVAYFCHVIADLCMSDQFDTAMMRISLPSQVMKHPTSRSVGNFKYPAVSSIVQVSPEISRSSTTVNAAGYVNLGFQNDNQQLSVAPTAAYVGAGNVVASSTVPYVAQNSAACVRVPSPAVGPPAVLKNVAGYDRQFANITAVEHERVAPSGAHDPIAPPPANSHPRSNIEIGPPPQNQVLTSEKIPDGLEKIKTDDVTELVDDLILGGFDWSVANPSEIVFDMDTLDDFVQ